GEDIPHLNIRPHYKHRGVAKSFEGLRPGAGVLVAERVEGIASVAHALAFCHAIETLTGTVVPAAARLVRVAHAELERITNHLDVVMRLTDAAGLAVATARFGWHKEGLMRLVSRMCGNRFGRSVIVPGGVTPRIWMVTPEHVTDQLASMMTAVQADTDALMSTASFLDRVRGTGRLDPELARRCGALGPVGRACGFDDDDRWQRGYDAYPDLPTPRRTDQAAGDAAARLRVRLEEMASSAELVGHALGGLDTAGGMTSAEVHPSDGFALGWAEAPQGEVLYAVRCSAGRIVRCLARSASFHNLLLFHDVFRGDVLTDFPFIEASFGLSPAGVAM
ncbi:MAG: NADH-quinone oxidoreductase subunit D, partial [Actinomycetota bacterium]|nr:NADH-quinone oxidoreductase subunit D [Actinomycetota bacterium]